MDSTKYRLFTIIFLLFTAQAGIAQQLQMKGSVSNSSGQDALSYASVSLLSKDSVFISGTTTNEQGSFVIDKVNPGDYILSVSYTGYNPKLVFIQNLYQSADITILLEEAAVGLDEVVVSASPVIRRVNERIVFPTVQQLKHASSGMNLLQTMMLPGIQVNPFAGSITAGNNGKVLLQINNVNVSYQEILSVRPSDIVRIEYKDYAGIRYRDYSAVIHFITKQKERGGVVGVDMMNAVTSLSAGDVFYLKLNKGRSEFALNYILVLNDLHKERRQRVEEYRFQNGNTLYRNDSSFYNKNTLNSHQIDLSYNYRLNDSAFFHSKVKLNTLRHPHEDYKSNMLINNVEKVQLSDALKQTNLAPSADFYFHSALKNNQSIYANLVFSWLDMDIQRDYNERTAYNTGFSQQTRMQSDKFSFIAEGVYEKQMKKNVLKVGLKQSNSFTRLRYEQPSLFSSRLPQSETFLFADWLYERDKWSYEVALGVNRYHYTSEDITKNFYHFLPKIMIAFRPNPQSLLRYEGEITQTNPTLQELTGTAIRIDSVLYESGNPNLRSYLNIKNSLYYEYNKGKFTGTIALKQHHKQHPVMLVREEREARFVSVPYNMKRWNKYNAEGTGRIGLLNDMLQLSLTGGANRYESVGHTYSYDYSNLYYAVNVLFMYNKWMFIGMLRSADKELFGETVHSANNYHYVSLQYNASNFSIGAGAFNPFGFVSESVWENRNANAPYTKKVIGNDSRMFVLTFTWSLNFGKRYQSQNKVLQNEDTDSGLRTNYR